MALCCNGKDCLHFSVCFDGLYLYGVGNCRRAAAIGANYVRSRTKRISCCNDIVRDSFFSSRVAVEINLSTVIDCFQKHFDITRACYKNESREHFG